MIIRKIISICTLAMGSLLATEPLVALEMNTDIYDIYIGDINNDGMKDYYFHGKDKYLILHGDIAIPILFQAIPDFAIFRSADGYAPAQLLSLTDSDLTSRITQGQLRKASISNTGLGTSIDAIYWKDEANGFTSVILRGANLTDPSLMLVTTTYSDLPLVAGTYGYIPNQLNLSDRAIAFALQDANADGRRDLVSGAQVLLANYTGLINGVPVALSSLGSQIEAAYTTASRYNLVGQLTGVIKPDADGFGSLRLLATRNTYDEQGLLLKVEIGELSYWQNETIAPVNWQGFSVFKTQLSVYNDLGFKIIDAVLNPQGTTESLTQYSYDKFDRVECKTRRLSAKGWIPSSYGNLPEACTPSNSSYGYDRVTRYTYDEWGNVLTEKRGVGTTLEQTYATNTYIGKRITSQVDANGNKTELEYDDNARLEFRYYPNKTRTANQSPLNPGQPNTQDFNEYRYDLNGNLEYERKRNGAIIQYKYDANNRKTKNDYVDNSKDILYTYNLLGLTKTSKFTSGDGVTNNYYGFGWVKDTTTTMLGTSRQLRYDYDNNGNRTKLTHPDGQAFVYGFDGINRVNLVAENSNANTLLTLTYKRYGLRDKILRNPVDNSLTAYTGAATEYGHDGALRLSQFKQNLASTAALTTTFVYNPANQVIEFTRTNNQYQYQGDENRKGVYVPNGLNQYTSIAGQALNYDNNGNLTNDGSQAYTYDDENRLLTVSGSTGGTMVYDPLGRLFETNITVNNVTTKTRFLYDGDALVAEYNASGTMTRRYVHGDQVDEPWVQYNGASLGATNRRYLHTDHQGSIIAHSNSSGGRITALAYDSFGIPKSTNSDRFGYTGQAWLSELGLFHYKARFYHPKLGRFLQTDPIGYADQMNMYAYVHNDPINYVDSTGRAGEFIGLRLVVAGVAIDATTPDPSDAAAPVKAAGYIGAIIGTTIGGSIVWIGNNLFNESNESASGESSEESESAGKSRNQPPEPAAEAEGRPHSIIEKPGKDGQYTTHNGDGTKKQYRGSGKDHGPVPRPNVKEFGKNITPKGKEFFDKGRVRPPKPEEIPK